ncbi:chromate transporter [Microvirga sp. KLBC 81]|uniref:chromate transporter n=1 Tax=Microvirga sp. KLBC 81 TaxID=1862707 RepID=UPI000D51CBA1|nr:chromate transporter [Microvirga sp. KLBC 81]PVE24890.1 chromate transporter [Microvirga sp. KLBC 81]
MLQVPSSEAAPLKLHVECLELFMAFCSVGLSGFGGVLPWARRMLVEQRRWLTDEEFTNIVSLCQFLPGPNITNVSICVGARFAGFRGSLSALSGILAVPVIIVILLAMLYDAYGHIKPVQDAFRGISSAAAGLIVGMAIKMAYPMRRSFRAITFMALTIGAVLVLKLPLIWILLVLVPPSIVVAWMMRR